MEHPTGKKLTGSKVYDELPENFKQVLDRACYAAYKAGYAEGYQDAKAGADDYSKVDETCEPANLCTGKKWKGKESESWKWV